MTFGSRCFHFVARLSERSTLGTLSDGNFEMKFSSKKIGIQTWYRFFLHSSSGTLYTRASALACENAIGMRQKSRTSDPGTESAANI